MIKAEKNFELWWIVVRFAMGEIHPSRYSESSIETIYVRYAMHGKVATLFEGCPSEREQTGDHVGDGIGRYEQRV